MPKKTPPKYKALGLDEKVRLVLGWLEEKKASDLTVLDMDVENTLADVIIVATARSVRQVKALADHVLYEAKHGGVEHFGMEGERGSDWVLVDLNDVLVHIFVEGARRAVDLEGLWPASRLAPPDGLVEGGQAEDGPAMYTTQDFPEGYDHGPGARPEGPAPCASGPDGSGPDGSGQKGPGSDKGEGQ